MSVERGSTITVDATEVYRALGIITDLPKELRPASQQAMAHLKAKMQEYPPARGNYDRTYALKHGWHYQTFAAGDLLGWVYSEGVDYADWVQSEAKQAWMHEGYWQTEEQVRQQEEEYVLSIYEEFISSKLASA